MGFICYTMRYEWPKVMVCYDMVCYEIETKILPYTEGIQTFQRKIVRSQNLPLICNVNNYI